MAEQKKNMGTSKSGTQENSRTPSNSGTQAKPETGQSPSYEQGREHQPDVDARKNAADTRSTNEHAQADKKQQGNMSSPNERKDRGTSDAERTKMEGASDVQGRGPSPEHDREHTQRVEARKDVADPHHTKEHDKGGSMQQGNQEKQNKRTDQGVSGAERITDEENDEEGTENEPAKLVADPNTTH